MSKPWWVAALAVLATVAGGVLIARHALGMAAQGRPARLDNGAQLQAILPGASFTVSDAPGARITPVAGGAIVALTAMQAGPLVRRDLCQHGLPLTVGAAFARLDGEIAARHALLKRADSAMPQLTLGAAGDSLQVRWQGAAQWRGDVPGDALRRLGWLVWHGGALRIERRSSRCALGELSVQAFFPAPAANDGPALVTALADGGAQHVLHLAPGDYVVPPQADAVQEDEALFASLREHGLLRVAPGGLLALAPPDLAQWLVADARQRAGDLSDWAGLAPDAALRKLLKRLYRQADGAYVRQQVDIFNSERRLLAWRLAESRSGAAATVRAVGSGGGVLAEAREMPPLAGRFFAELPQGWQAWRRAAHWLGDEAAVLELTLAEPARAGQVIELLLAGRLDAQHVAGGSVRALPVCSGAACPAIDAVQRLLVLPQAGARRVALTVRALDVAGAQQPGDQRYRHIRLVQGTPQWQRLAPAAGAPGPSYSTAGVRIADRAGRLLWADGAPLPAARAAGLATLLGVTPDQQSGVAGMLARAAGAGVPPTAQLSIDLDWQSSAQAIVECQGLRGGHWRAGVCSGGSAPPAGRRSGLLLLDADNGDVLLAAGAGMAPVDAGNWREARDFDRGNPARSALRLPAWQHDGGAHSSPGSAFKVVSALGLELAARGDRALDAMLGGLPLAQLDRMAQERGFAFRSDAPRYPFPASGAHITNYREQSLQRRVEAGRLGLPQALAHSLNTWFAWGAELSDQTLYGRAEGGAPGVRAVERGALEALRPIAAAADLLGFGKRMRLDGGLLPAGFRWSEYDALQSTPSLIDPIDSRHEVRQMAIGLRMQATPLQMAVVSAAVGAGRVPAPRVLLALDGRPAGGAAGARLALRLDRIRAGMKGVVDGGTAAGAFAGPALAALRPGLYGKTGTAPVTDGEATVWFTGWLEPGSLPGQPHRLAFAAFVSRSQDTGGGHAAPMVAALLEELSSRNIEQAGKAPANGANGALASMAR